MFWHEPTEHKKTSKAFKAMPRRNNSRWILNFLFFVISAKEKHVQVYILKMPRRRLQGGKGVLNILRNILNEWKIIRPRRITQSAKFFISYRKRRIEELLIVKPECVLISAFYVKFRDGEKFKWQVAKSRQEMGSWSRLLGNYIIWHYINSFGLDMRTWVML